MTLSMDVSFKFIQLENRVDKILAKFDAFKRVKDEDVEETKNLIQSARSLILELTDPALMNIYDDYTKKRLNDAIFGVEEGVGNLILEGHLI